MNIGEPCPRQYKPFGSRGIRLAHGFNTDSDDDIQLFLRIVQFHCDVTRNLTGTQVAVRTCTVRVSAYIGLHSTVPVLRRKVELRIACEQIGHRIQHCRLSCPVHSREEG